MSELSKWAERVEAGVHEGDTHRRHVGVLFAVVASESVPNLEALARVDGEELPEAG